MAGNSLRRGLQHTVGVIMKLKPNNSLVRNDVKASFAAEAYISTEWRRGLLVYFDVR